MTASTDAPQWDPGTLSSTELDRVLTDALADLWRDCYRRDQALQDRQRMFDRKVIEAVRCATGYEPAFSIQRPRVIA